MSVQKVNVEDLERELVGHTFDDDDGVDIGRGKNLRNMREAWGKGDGGWGNPFVLESLADERHYKHETISVVADREEAIERFESLLVERAQHDASFRRRLTKLAGKKLDCWCQHRGEHGDACHGTVLAKWALYFDEQ